MVAWDFRNGSLTRRWTYDSGSSNTGLYAQGNHQLSIGDTDGDGRDEIIYGSAALDDNGTLLWPAHPEHLSPVGARTYS